MNKLPIVQFITLIFLFQIPYSAFTQRDYIKGKIITNDYDTIDGFILANQKYTNKNQVVFSQVPTSKNLETYYPEQLLKFILDSKEYVSMPVSYYEEQEELNFLHRVAYGYCTLYEGFTSDGEEFYCLQTEDNKVTYLPKESISEWVQQYFSDCEFKHRRIFYDKESIGNLLSKYSHCKQPDKFVYQKHHYKQSLLVGFKLGTNITYMKFVSKNNPYYNKTFHPYPYLGYQGGFTFNFDISRYLQIEIDLFISKLQAELVDSVTLNFERIDINVPILIRYIVKRNFGIEPYFNLGLDLRTMAKQNFQYTDSLGDKKLEPRNGAAGLLAGVGIIIPTERKMKLAIDFQYSYFQHVSHIRPSTSNEYDLENQVIIFSTGILF